MKKKIRHSTETLSKGFRLFTWQVDFLKQLASEEDRNLSSMLRRVVSHGLVALGHEETVLSHDKTYTPIRVTSDT